MIIAVDFDGTLCDDVYPNIGQARNALIDVLKEKRRTGNKLILWTCRTGERLKQAVIWCISCGLHFDAINENLPENTKKYGNDSRKIHADIYLDDKVVDGENFMFTELLACGKFCNKFETIGSE